MIPRLFVVYYLGMQSGALTTYLYENQVLNEV